MWMEENRGTRINADRSRQVMATGAETLATSCPFCMTMLSDGLAEAVPGGADGPAVTTLDIAEILAQAAIPGPAALAGTAQRAGRHLPIVG
jgi:Fe-S oxidoreductase